VTKQTANSGGNLMLMIDVKEKKTVNASFDITGDREGIVCYFIREVKLSMTLSGNDDSLADINHSMINALSGLPFCGKVDYLYTQPGVWIVKFNRLFGFSEFGYFKDTVQEQYEVIMKGLDKVIDQQQSPVQIECIFDAIY
jgi:hypothetical protein